MIETLFDLLQDGQPDDHGEEEVTQELGQPPRTQGPGGVRVSGERNTLGNEEEVSQMFLK